VSNFYIKPGLAPGKYRIEMLQEAIRNDRWLRLDTWEAEQPTWTRTKLLLDHHLEKVKQRFGPDTEVRLLAGQYNERFPMIRSAIFI
jgi:nicotinic acid mononucleotide adenylyltransferase